MFDLRQLVSSSLKYYASCLYLVPDNPPAVKSFDEIIFLQVPNLSCVEIIEIIKSILDEKQYDILSQKGLLETVMDFDNNYFLRIKLSYYEGIPEIIIDIIKKKIYTMEEIKAPKELNQIINLSQGFLLITGPLNSGKNSMITALLHEINSTQKKHILVFTDNQIFNQKSQSSLVNYYKLSLANFNFINKKSADIIFFSNLCDLKLINTAIDCVRTGHLVIAVVDAISIEYAIERIISMFADRNFGLNIISNHLTSIMMQFLVKKKNVNDKMCIYNFMRCDETLKFLIKEDKLDQIVGSQLVEKINNLINEDILDYKHAIVALEKLGITKTFSDDGRKKNIF